MLSATVAEIDGNCCCSSCYLQQQKLALSVDCPATPHGPCHGRSPLGQPDSSCASRQGTAGLQGHPQVLVGRGEGRGKGDELTLAQVKYSHIVWSYGGA